MINQKTAQEAGVTIIDSQQVLTTKKQALIEQLKAILPNVINADNQLDIKALQDVVDISNTTSNNQGYELTFAGKGIARAMADKPNELELKVEIEQSKNFDSTDNVVIRGDNLEVLKILQANYHKKIKMIYIDPPYNTKKESFTYKDNFKQSDEQLIEDFHLDEEAVDFLHNVYGTRSHSGWLSFIYPRLKLARDLLSDDGVIFISIDDNEQANLKILCDEIFGEDNFEGNIHWRRRNNQPNDRTKMLGLVAEHILTYSKNQEIYKESGVGKVELTGKFSNPDNDPNGAWATKPWKAGSDQGGSNYCITTPTGKVYDETWMGEEKTFNALLKDDRIIFPKNGKGCPRKKYYKFEREQEGQSATNWWSHDEFGCNQEASDEVANIFGKVKNIFSNPKPAKLIKNLIQLSNTQENHIVLDFFAGSGTTADAIMQLNNEDNKHRKFILVQIDEPIDNKKELVEAYKFCIDNNFKSVISSITIERINRAGEKIKADLSKEQGNLFDENKLPDIGYKVFSCIQKPQVSGKNNLLKVENNRNNVLDTLINMLVATCKTLDTKIECLIKNKLYQADNEIYLLANVDSKVLEKYQDVKINLDGWADIDLTQYLNLGIGQADNISVIY